MTRVLIVEDSATQAQELAFLLESEGFDVDLAVDGFRGLEQCRRGGYDVVLSDVIMPNMDGYELCRRIKADEATRNLPVVLLTSLAEPMDIISGLECGADNFITKPYDGAYLVGRVRQLLDTRGLRAGRKVAVGVDLWLMGRRFTVNSEKEQMLDLLISTFEEVLRSRQREYEARLGEESLRASERLLQSALDALSTQIAIIDEGGTIRAVNAPWRKFAERAGADWSAAGAGAPYLDVWASIFEGASTDRSALAEGLEAVAARRRDVLHLEMTARIGEEQRVFTLTATRFDGPGPALVAIEHEDITDRRKAEMSLRSVEDQLRQAQKMEAIGQLAGGVAHDFNNVLAVIASYSEMVLTDLPAHEPLREDIEEIKRAAQRGAGLTRQLLAFSRRQPISPVVLDLNQIVREVQSMLRRALGGHIDLVARLDPDLARTRVDGGQVEQILLNLAVNARDAMPTGGVLSIETRNVIIDASIAGLRPDVIPGPYVLLSVTDTGVGMDRETQARIFEPFFTTKEVGKGTGLGLSTVFGIVRQSGGHIYVYSEPGRGSTFKVYLPAVDEVPAALERRTSRPPAAPRAATVLVVEDDEAVRQVVGRILRQAEFTVLEADRPDAARTLSQGHAGAIDVLLADIVLPTMDGVELAAELSAARPEMRILLMSGYAAAHRGALASSSAFLEKPFTPDSLIRKVREVLDG